MAEPKAVDLTEYNGHALVGTAAVFLSLSWISVALRTYVRAVLTKNFLADDWLMLIAQVIFTLSCAFLLEGVSVGLGRHNAALEEASEIQAIMWQALATATYILDMMFIKLSIGVFLLRLAIERRYKYILWGALAVVFVWSVVLFFWNLFQCNPVAAQWDYRILRSDPNSHCVTSDQIVQAAYALSVMTIVTDWLFALLPIPMVWNVKMTSQAKAGVIVILGLGIFASVATLIRLKFLADLNDVDDILFAGTDAMVWTLVEPGVAIVASSLVTIRPLLRRFRLHGFETTENTPNYGNQRSGASAGRMPGFGHDDVAFVDLETQHDGKDDRSLPASSSVDADTTQERPVAPNARSHYPTTPPLVKPNPSPSADEELGYHSPRRRHSEVSSQAFADEGEGQGRAGSWNGRDQLESASEVSLDSIMGVVSPASQAGQGRGAR